MATSEARWIANQANAAKSTGPKTLEGKEKSRANSLKHGMTGAGVVLPNEDAVEIERRVAAFQAELKPTSEVARSLVFRIAVSAVRMERGVSQETAALSERVRQAEADFVAPEGLDDDSIDRLRSEAARVAMFDPSKEACLARKYEAAAERCFFKGLKELRTIQTASPVAAPVAEPLMDEETVQKTLASFFQIEKALTAREARFNEPVPSLPVNPRNRLEPGYLGSTNDFFDVPITVGKAR